MKIIIFLAVIASTKATIDFDEFVQLYGKTYNSEAEKEAARENFNTRVSHINSFNEQESTFKQKVNKFSDIDTAERRRLNGFQLSIFSRVMVQESNIRLRTALPSSVDWRTRNVVTDVQDQGYYCGSCWAYATTGVLEGAIAIMTKRTPIKLSEQQFLDCNYNSIVGNYGCDGGYMNVALAFAKLQDITTESAYPYVESQGSCNYNRSQTRYTFAVPVMVPSGDENALKMAVATYGPVAAAIDAGQESFYYYSSGVYFEPKCTQWPNHAVLIVGYGTDLDGGDYWLIKNSWSTDWGMSGYMKLARNRNSHCGISRYAVYMLLNKINTKP